MSLEKIRKLFSHKGVYKFSRWNKPISPVVFGVNDTSLSELKSAFSEVVSLSYNPLSDIDPDFGSNFMTFFCSDWEELHGIPNLEKLIINLGELVKSLERRGSNQYRSFRFSSDGSIRLCILLLKYDKELASVSVQTLGTNQMLQSILLWSPEAFKEESPIAYTRKNNYCFIKPFYSALIKASYDRVLPDVSYDSDHALRLMARVNILLEPSNGT